MSNGNWNLHEHGGDQLLTTTALTKQVPPLSIASEAIDKRRRYLEAYMYPIVTSKAYVSPNATKHMECKCVPLSTCIALAMCASRTSWLHLFVRSLAARFVAGIDRILPCLNVQQNVASRRQTMRGGRQWTRWSVCSSIRRTSSACPPYAKSIRRSSRRVIARRHAAPDCSWEVQHVPAATLHLLCNKSCEAGFRPDCLRPCMS